MITHEEVRKLLNTTEMGESPTRLYERKLKIHDYITQQEKKDELLGLYRNFQYHVYSGNVSPRDRLNEKILKLEKGLGEMK